MTTRVSYLMVARLQSGDFATARNDQISIQNTTQSAVWKQGQVVEVQQDTVTIETDIGVRSAQLSTDEPIFIGNLVWYAPTEDGGILVMGTVK